MRTTLKSVKLICKKCGKEYLVQATREETSHYCSLACYWKRSERVKVNCDYCGKEFEIFFFETKNIKKHYCNNKCRFDKMRATTPWKCEKCGKDFMITYMQIAKSKKKLCDECRNASDLQDLKEYLKQLNNG